QVTVPPSPLAPSSRSARSSPVRHFADLTNWNTPIGQPWFHARSAMPNAAVDFPLPGPVCTITSGRFRRCRVVSPSSGITGGLPCGISHRLRVGSPGGYGGARLGQRVEGEQGGPQPGGEAGRQAEPYRAGLAVDDHARRAGQQAGGAVGGVAVGGAA